MEASIVPVKTSATDITLQELEDSGIQEYTKLHLNDSLDYIIPEDLSQKLFIIKSKLLNGGKIVIHSYDLYELAQAVLNDKMSTIDFNNIITNRGQLLCIPDLVFILNRLGFKVVSKDVDALKYIIEAENVRN